jgi:hypothetical protein
MRVSLGASPGRRIIFFQTVQGTVCEGAAMSKFILVALGLLLASGMVGARRKRPRGDPGDAAAVEYSDWAGSDAK